MKKLACCFFALIYLVMLSSCETVNKHNDSNIFLANPAPANARIDNGLSSEQIEQITQREKDNAILWEKIKEVAILMNVTMTKTEVLDSYIFSRRGVPHFNEGYPPPPCGDLREIYEIGRLFLYIDEKGQPWAGIHSVSMLDEGKLDAILKKYKSGEGSDIDDAVLFINKDAKISEIIKILSILSDNNIRCVNFMASFSDYSYHRIARFFIKSKILDSPELTIGKDSEIHFNGKKYSADDFKKNFIDSSNEQMDKKASDIMNVTLSFSTPDMTYGDVVGVFMLLGQATFLRVSFPEMSRNPGVP